MDHTYRLKILSNILAWSNEESRIEFEWLKLMSSVKYDDYRDYLPGMRFFENLSSWLQQFDSIEERREAYALLRKRLIYISPAEIQRLVELSYHCVIERTLIGMVAQRRKIPKYMVRVDAAAKADFDCLLRRTLILGLSDGARMDILRQSTVGILNNEQFVIQSQIDKFKWRSLLKDLRKSKNQGEEALFEVVFLVDDFMGTGSSFLRKDDEDKKWKGKLGKFLESLEDVHKATPIVSDDWQLCVHHYLGTEEASAKIQEREAQAIKEKGINLLTKASIYTFGETILGKWKVSKTDPADKALFELTQKYYNRNVETEHTAVGGEKHIGLGYGGCALPLVIHHNTPNNSLALLWADLPAGPFEGATQREVRPLFRRRQRHT